MENGKKKFSEREGFEPSMIIYHIDVPGLHLKPLGHLSHES
jgi:hypothetical protein